MSFPLRGRVVKLVDVTDDEVRAWSELAARAATPNPAFEPGCLVPARHLVNGHRIQLAIADSGSVMYGLFPFEIVDRWGAFRRAVLTSQVRRMPYDGTPLLDRGRAVDAATAMLSAIRDAPDLPGILVNDWVDDDGIVAASIEQAARNLGRRSYRYRQWQRPMVSRGTGAEARDAAKFDVSADGDVSARQMSEEFSEPVRTVDCTDDPGIIQRVIELESAGYKWAQGSAIAQHPGETEWFTEMCESFRAQQRLHVSGLRLDDRYLALQLSLRGGDGLFGLKYVYDEQFRRTPPGADLRFDATGCLFAATDASWFDSCTYEGNHEMLDTYPDRRPIVSLVTTVGGRFDRHLVDGVRAARGLKAWWLKRRRAH